MEVNIYIGFWTLKMKCIPYGLYEPPTMNPKSTLFISTFSDKTRSVLQHKCHRRRARYAVNGSEGSGQLKKTKLPDVAKIP